MGWMDEIGCLDGWDGMDGMGWDALMEWDEMGWVDGTG